MQSTLEKYQKVYQMLADEIYRQYRKKLYRNSGILLRKTSESLFSSIPERKPIILYGAGKYAKRYLPFWDDKRFVGFCSRTKEKLL